MAMPAIQVGDEVKLRKLKDQPVAVVLLNEADRFCCVTKDGVTYSTSRAGAYPIKTGRRFEGTKAFLDSLR